MAALSYSPEQFITEEEYFDIELSSREKFEYMDGQVWMMAGGSPSHAIVTSNVSASLHGQLRGSGCRGYSSDVRIRVGPANSYLYPDAAFVCGQPRHATARRGIESLLNPTLILEVLSPSTQDRDRNSKWALYRQLDSMRDYLLISQDAPRIEHRFRGEDGSWSQAIHEGLEAEFAFAGAPAAVRLSEVYEFIDFASQATD